SMHTAIKTRNTTTTTTSSAAPSAPRMTHGRKRRSTTAPRVARAGRGCAASGTPSAWREPWLTLLAYAELDVLDFDEERARVQAVRRALCARFDGQPSPALELGDLAFTIGLVAAAMGTDPAGLLSQCQRLLSPSALAEYERAKGFVRLSPISC